MSDGSFRDRLRSADDAARLVRDRDEIYLPLAPAQPAGLLAALARRERFDDLHVLCALLQERFALLEHPGVRVTSQFFGHVERDLVRDGVAIDHLTSDFHGLELIARRTRPRVVATTVSPPDEDGFLSFGVHAGATIIPFLEAARDPERVAIAEVNARTVTFRRTPLRARLRRVAAGSPLASTSRIGHSGRSSPWQQRTRCSSVFFMASSSCAFCSSACIWASAMALTRRLDRLRLCHRLSNSPISRIEKPRSRA